MAVRIKDLTTTATEAASDDYVAIDGATNGTRKILASKVGNAEIDFTSALTPSVDSRGVSMMACLVTPTNASDVALANVPKIKLYLDTGTYIYPLITVAGNLTGSDIVLRYKSIDASTQSTTSYSVSGTLHAVAPFEITSITSYM